MAGIGLANAAHAATSKTENQSAVSLAAAKVLVNGVTHGNLHVVRTFSGPGKGITGVVAEAGNGHKMLAWMVDDTLLAPGPLLNAAGQNLSMQVAQQQHLIPKPIASGKLAKAALEAPGFTIGKSGPLMTAFLDPNCIFCHLLWNQIQPEIAAGKVRLKVVPVGFLKPSSFPKAVTVMMNKDPAKAWAYSEVHFNVRKEEGAVIPAKVLNTKISAEIRANTHLLAESGTVATPTLVVCEGQGKDPVVMHGVGRNALPGIIHDAISLDGNGVCGPSAAK